MANVSVWITTYNHEKYIAQAIDSVLAQILTHQLEIIIGEDRSTDDTRNIIKSYQTKYPEIIKLYLSDHNMGCNPMFYQTYSLCTGNYIAWLDGDDYWTCPYKLQTQIDFLEQHPNLIFCFHKVTIEDSISHQLRESTKPTLGKGKTFNLEEFILNDIQVHSPSLVHKNIIGKDLPKWFYSLPLADLAFYYLLLEYGNGYYINKNMAVYRIHDRGSWSSASYFKKNYQFGTFYKTYKSINPLLKVHLEQKICYYYSFLFEHELLSRNYIKAFDYFQTIKDNNFRGFNNRKIWICKLLIKFFIKLLNFKKK